jgi:hypothetical protein
MYFSFSVVATAVAVSHVVLAIHSCPARSGDVLAR